MSQTVLANNPLLTCTCFFYFLHRSALCYISSLAFNTIAVLQMFSDVLMFSASDKYAETFNAKKKIVLSQTAQIAHARSVCLLHVPHQLHQTPPALAAFRRHTRTSAPVSVLWRGISERKTPNLLEAIRHSGGYGEEASPRPASHHLQLHSLLLLRRSQGHCSDCCTRTLAQWRACCDAS